MHPDTAATKVVEAHQALVEHVLMGPGEDGSSGELEALVQGERGPGVQEVLTAKAMAELARQVAELARQVAELTERVRALESTKDMKTSTPTTKKGK
jgi:hypothetical protein